MTNKNLDAYHDDFFKGLSLAQTASAVGVLVSAGLSFAFFYVVLKIPMSMAIYLALPFALPFGIGGFLKIHGMSPFEYLHKKRLVEKQDMLVYRPAYVLDSRKRMEEGIRKKSKGIQGEFYLETEEELNRRMKEVDALFEKKEVHEGI